MKKYCVVILSFLAAFSAVIPVTAFARTGDNGYEGGISAETKTGQFDYREVCFISGEPVVFKGTLTIKKNQKQDTATKQDIITATYTYSSLVNNDKSASITRTNVIYTTRRTKKDNGQVIEETSVGNNTSSTSTTSNNNKMTEIIKIGNDTYTLTNYNFTRTNIIDSRPAIDYIAGDIHTVKVYQKSTSAGTGTSTGTTTVTVEGLGNSYGYNQYWGTTGVDTIKYTIQGDVKNGTNSDQWGGEATVSLSSSAVKQLKYVDNEPKTMSFDGGFVLTQNNSSIMEYAARLPEFDSKGISTDRAVEWKDSAQVETFPNLTRLPIANLGHLKGHWAENDIKALYGLEVFKGNDTLFDPEKYMTRAEFTVAILKAAREVPADPLLQTTAAARPAAAGRNTKVVSPFADVSTENMYFSQINDAYKRGLISGIGMRSFGPDENLTLADALTIFIRTLGLEGMASSGGAVTTFKDNDDIPDYARSATYVAEKIGLIQGDDRGYLYPGSNLTNARAAALINRFIGYMREGLRKDYREGIVNY